MNDTAERLPDLVRRWQAGWRLARGLAAAELTEDLLQVRFGLPHRHLEFVALRADEAPGPLARLAERVAEATEVNWLTVPTNEPERATEILRAAGLEVPAEPEWLMSVDLTRHPRPAPAPPYRREVRVDGAVIAVTITDGSGAEMAARGWAAFTGTDAVADRIETSAEHRRRGLGSAMMGSLTEAAMTQGATTGLLVASVDGQRLYSSLGWERRAYVLIGRKPSVG
ncbi:GNAT family N-acetyltransferase [Micromonospora sp. NPDC049523]|uniref:GNAT family N-acetyltransferase n=1 Tax=Micromonospora sp. NPDC049523 TaxID=3155921 RepID=UPI003415481A